MSLLQPWHLWALVGLAVPVAIHLLSRKEGRLIRMGSLRHIRETSSRQFRSIKLNEYLLLALRSIVVTLLVLLMSGWYLKNLRDDRKWLVIERGVENDSSISALRASFRENGYEERYLLPGFPLLDDRPEEPSQPDYPARLEELQRLVVDSAVIVATNRVGGFNGKRIALPPQLRWIAVTPPQKEFQLAQMLTGIDSLFVRTGKSSSSGTSYATEITPRGDASARTAETIRVVVASDETFMAERQIVLAVLQAIRKSVPEKITIESITTSSPVPKTDWMIWLSDSSAPKVTGNLVYFNEQSEQPLLLDVARGKVVLTARLNSEVAIANNFAVQLMRRIIPSAEFLESAQMNDVRTVADNTAWSKTNAGVGPTTGEQGNDASTIYLLVALIFFMLLERMVSYQRSQ